MTTSITFSTVANAIEALTITGVTIKDIDNIPESVAMSTPVLFPDTNGYIDGVTIERDEITGQWLRLNYTLHYRYIHCPASGGLGGLYASYSGLISKVASILYAFATDATLSGAMDNQAPTVTELGIVTDPSGNDYFGCVFNLNIMQFVEV